MALRTYFWYSRILSRVDYFKFKILRKPLDGFKYGNAGDVFARDLIKFIYKEDVYNTRDAGNRLLVVGSLASVIKEKDVINGIGWKGNNLDNIAQNIANAKVYGVRGPLTKQLFEKHNADLSDLKFMLDPGLLIKEVYKLREKETINKKQISFIPHYNDTLDFKKIPDFFKIISIDNKPKTVARAIMKSKIVYTSSLHGIIFSHALKVPCVFVSPQSNEPIFKYKDYFLSVNIKMPKPLESIYIANLDNDEATFLDRNITLEDFYFPSKDELKSRSIIF